MVEASNLLLKATEKLIELRQNPFWAMELPPRCPPILWFGNKQSAKPKVLTLGANPSRQEYLADSSAQALNKVEATGDHSQCIYLEEPNNRFYLLPDGLPLSAILTSEAHQRAILRAYSTYFDRNPYARWFGMDKLDSYNVEGFLRGLGASYYSGDHTDYQAIHIDLFPFATLSDFKQLREPSERVLFDSGWAQNLVLALVALFEPVALVIFGKTNFSYFGIYIDSAVRYFPQARYLRGKYYLGESTKTNCPIIGLSTNLGNPVGFSAASLRAYGEHIRHQGKFFD